MKETYYLNKRKIPTIPVPHDCIIKKINLDNQFLIFTFEDDISYHDSIKCLNIKAKSLIIKYHLIDNIDNYIVYKWFKPRKNLSKNGYYKSIDNNKLVELTNTKFKLEYLYHNIGYCSIILKLFLKGYIILDANVDYIEYEWIY